MSRSRRWFVLALVTQLVGAGATLLFATRIWQSAYLYRQRPLPTVGLALTGRTVSATPTALALVALAGVVAVLASSGLIRRVIGALVALAGLGIGAAALPGLTALSGARLRSIARSRKSGVLLDDSTRLHADVHAVWPVLTIVAALLIAVAGVLCAILGAGWSGMSRRYERSKASEPIATGAPAPTPAVGADSIRLWNSLDRGEDPTGHE